MKFLKNLFLNKSTNSGIKTNAKKRLARMEEINFQWAGIIVSQDGKFLKIVVDSMDITPGKYLYFPYHCESNGGRIEIVDVACLWLNVKKELSFYLSGNMHYPIPKEIKNCITDDETYDDWKTALKAIENFFENQPQEGWYNQWAWRSDRVKKFMKGKHNNWISQ
jgi:hypothetical protein